MRSFKLNADLEGITAQKNIYLSIALSVSGLSAIL
jgi:hypothetical protein